MAAPHLTPNWEGYMKPGPPPQLLQPHPDFRNFGDAGLYLYWVVHKLNHRGSRQKRVLVVTDDGLFITTLDGKTSRALKLSTISTVTLQSVVAESQQKLMSGKVLVSQLYFEMNTPGEPALLINLVPNKRNPQLPSGLTDAEHVLRVINHQRKKMIGSNLPVEDRRKFSPRVRRSFTHLKKTEAYQKPKDKLPVWRAASHPRIPVDLTSYPVAMEFPSNVNSEPPPPPVPPPDAPCSPASGSPSGFSKRGSATRTHSSSNDVDILGQTQGGTAFGMVLPEGPQKAGTKARDSAEYSKVVQELEAAREEAKRAEEETRRVEEEERRRRRRLLEEVEALKAQQREAEMQLQQLEVSGQESTAALDKQRRANEQHAVALAEREATLRAREATVREKERRADGLLVFKSKNKRPLPVKGPSFASLERATVATSAGTSTSTTSSLTTGSWLPSEQREEEHEEEEVEEEEEEEEEGYSDYLEEGEEDEAESSPFAPTTSYPAPSHTITAWTPSTATDILPSNPLDSPHPRPPTPAPLVAAYAAAPPSRHPPTRPPMYPSPPSPSPSVWQIPNLPPPIPLTVPSNPPTNEMWQSRAASNSSASAPETEPSNQGDRGLQHPSGHNPLDTPPHPPAGLAVGPHLFSPFDSDSSIDDLHCKPMPRGSEQHRRSTRRGEEPKKPEPMHKPSFRKQLQSTDRQGHEYWQHFVGEWDRIQDMFGTQDMLHDPKPVRALSVAIDAASDDLMLP